MANDRYDPATGRWITPWDPKYRALNDAAMPGGAGGAPNVSQMSIAQGRSDLSGIGNPLQINQAAVSAADPFAPQRQQYQNALQGLMQGNFTPNDPSYQFRVGQGQQALERSQAAKGFLGSGNILQSLQDYGQGQGSTEYQNQYNRLLPLTGATTGSPGAAGSIQAGLYDWRNNALANIGGGMAAQQAVPGNWSESKLVWG